MSFGVAIEAITQSAWKWRDVFFAVLHGSMMELEYLLVCFVFAVNIAYDMHLGLPCLERQMKSSSKRRARLFYLSWVSSK